MTTSTTIDTALVRRQIVRRRSALSAVELDRAERHLVNHAMLCPQLLRSQRLLSYMPFRGEISPQRVAAMSRAQIYWPRITSFQQRRMSFYASPSMRKNRYGIYEPEISNRHCYANQLDLILVPLVAFDRCGNRIGMGAGYYDRALQSLEYQTSTRPFLLGVAHHFQELESIEARSWDVPLDAILTDQEFIQV